MKGGEAMIDFNYTAPELLPLRIQEVLDAPNEPHRIGNVVYVPEGGGECELNEVDTYSNAREVVHVLECSACGETCEHVNGSYPRCPHCGRKAVKR
jgi:DNA-directed RNA polymerase subunit RPC12/RpoP